MSLLRDLTCRCSFRVDNDCGNDLLSSWCSTVGRLRAAGYILGALILGGIASATFMVAFWCKAIFSQERIDGSGEFSGRNRYPDTILTRSEVFSQFGGETLEVQRLKELWEKIQMATILVSEKVCCLYRLPSATRKRIVLCLASNFDVEFFTMGEKIHISGSVHFVAYGSVAMFSSETSALSYAVRLEGQVCEWNVNACLCSLVRANMTRARTQMFGGSELYTVTNGSHVQANEACCVISIDAQILRDICSRFPSFGRHIEQLVSEEKDELV